MRRIWRKDTAENFKGRLVEGLSYTVTKRAKGCPACFKNEHHGPDNIQPLREYGKMHNNIY
jgi:hypothetical protein